MIRKVVLLYFLFISILSCSEKTPIADLVIFGGKIYTVTDVAVVEAVAVINNKIIFAGSEAEVRSFVGDQTEVVDLNGRIMTPGFIEGHGHFMGVGYNELNLDLMDTKSYDEIIERVAEAVSKAEPGQWIVGRGWHQDKWDTKPGRLVKGFPLHDKLSAVSPDNPVFLRHASGHAGLANAKAMELAGVNQLSVEQKEQATEEGGEIIRDELGNPTGLFSENAQGLIGQKIPENNEAMDRQAIELATQACLRNGITSFHDAGASRKIIDLYHQIKNEGHLGVRLYVMVTGWDRNLVYDWLKRGPEIDSSGWLTVRSIKLNCDGALGSRGAWLLEPYTDRPGFYGMPTLSMDTVLKTSREALLYGFQVCSHAIGDRANREVLDRYELALQEVADKADDHRFRIEHAQHIHPTDIPRFAALGVIPAMQAIHMSSDRPWAIDRLGEKRIVEETYVWQSLLSTGARIVNGTDAPVEPLNPIPSFYAAVTRKTLAGLPEGGYEPEQKMTRDQALKSYTLDAAYGAFEESIKGSIEPGKLADFTVFSEDIMTIPEDDILKASVSMVILDGRIVYRLP
jgi:hypothetical protein